MISTNISVKASPHNHLETLYNGMQILINEDLYMYLFHIQYKIPKAVKITKIRVETLKRALASLSLPESGGKGIKVNV